MNQRPSEALNEQELSILICFPRNDYHFDVF